MPLFAEMQATLNQTRFQRTILQHIIEHLDDSFLPVMGGNPNRVLLTEDRVKVPVEAFDSVVEYLNTWIKNLAAQEATMLNTTLVAQPPAPAAAEVKPEEQVTPVKEESTT